MSNEVNTITFLNYIKTFYKSVEEEPLNELDFAVFSKMVYYNFGVYIQKSIDSVKVKDIYDASKTDRFLKRINYSPEDEEIVDAFCKNPRFRNMSISNFVDKIDPANKEQFAAGTIQATKNDLVVAFRGTDTTLVGWREDFNMAFQCPVPSQLSSVIYLNSLKKTRGKNIYICGHSKGGNIAVFGFLSCKKSIKKKVKGVYSFDGPSCDDSVKKKLKFYENKSLIHKICPNESFIGLIYDEPFNVTYIKSYGTKLYQHNFVRWEVNLKNNEFLRTKAVDKNVQLFMKSLNEWLKICKPEEKEKAVDTLFLMLHELGFVDMKQIFTTKYKNILALWKSYRNLEKDTRAEVNDTFRKLFDLLKDNFFPPKQKKEDNINKNV